MRRYAKLLFEVLRANSSTPFFVASIAAADKFGEALRRIAKFALTNGMMTVLK